MQPTACTLTEEHKMIGKGRDHEMGFCTSMFIVALLTVAKTWKQCK